MKSSPDKHHFFENGEVFHEEKEKSDQSNVQADTAKNSSGPGVTKDKTKSRKTFTASHCV
jgi:hypothetical protein